MSSAGVASVDAYTNAVESLLARARKIKPNRGIEPALTFTDLSSEIEQIISKVNGGKSQAEAEKSQAKQARFAAIETAFRNVFCNLLATTAIEDPAFSDVWNLLDIVLIFSDRDMCEAGLVFWLVEEMLESQTIDGCRIIFDYLESRRERMIAKQWKSKHLIVLRACTELLRKLSRAEDTVFCGRVFIYLFQTFPLGDKSAVNLRGEFHVENTTVYDKLPTKAILSPESMDVDEEKPSEEKPNESGPQGAALPDVAQPLRKNGSGPTIATTDTKIEKEDEPLDADTLYPMFWSLQDYFSKPTELFKPANLRAFKRGLQATLTKFKQVQGDAEIRGVLKHNEEVRQGTKRKWGEAEDENSSSSFNPKYLTSRDLFELEISDLAFRRHILVQALILMEFLLSQTAKSKAKTQSLKNKSVIYDFTLDEKEAEWAIDLKSEISTYLQHGTEGKFYYRMVDTVLSRDKNWAYWKASGCPPFQRPSIPPSDYVSARTSLQKSTTTKRLRTSPMGALDLTSFLGDPPAATIENPSPTTTVLDVLRDPTRSTIPELASFERGVVDDEFEVERARGEEDKERALDARASKMWRALRVAAKRRFAALERLEEGGDSRMLFKEPEGGGEGEENGDGDGDGDEREKNGREVDGADGEGSVGAGAGMNGLGSTIEGGNAVAEVSA